jgi:hypothetical protein
MCLFLELPLIVEFRDERIRSTVNGKFQLTKGVLDPAGIVDFFFQRSR